MVCPVRLGPFLSGTFGERDRTLGDRELVDPRSPRQLLDRFPIAISRLPIHVRVGRCRIAPEHALDPADGLDKRGPVQRREHAHRVDDVGNRQLIDRLALMLDPQDLVGRLTARVQPGLEPAPGGGGGDRLVSKVMKNFDEKRGRGLGSGLQRRLRSFTSLEQAVRERPRRFSFLFRPKRLSREAAEVFDERQAQHDRNRPQLSDGQRRHVLVRVRKAAQRLLIEAAGRVGHEIPREHVDPRITTPASPGQGRQFLVVLAGKIAADLEQLRTDDVVVVPEPFL